MYPRQYLYNDAHGLIRNVFHLQDYIRDDLINSIVEVYFFSRTRLDDATLVEVIVSRGP